MHAGVEQCEEGESDADSDYSSESEVLCFGVAI